MKTKTALLFFLAVISFVSITYSSCNQNIGSTDTTAKVTNSDSTWHAPDSLSLANNPAALFIRYGKNLVANTSYYLGPKGKVARVSNGMNCQNCHLQAGTVPFGFNFASVASLYPKFRPRSGKVENLCERINNCLQRSLNGKIIDSACREMKAMVAYMEWVGKDVPKGKILYGKGTAELTFPDSAADPNKGEIVYIQKCQACHGKNGNGLPDNYGIGFIYPPLWGESSYNSGASMFRLIELAAFVKYNMPFGVTWQVPQLTDDEAWDVAAFINSRQRPIFNTSKDWPDLADKPIDYPLGPYTDGFSETQHKYGPYKPIAEARKQLYQKKHA